MTGLLPAEELRDVAVRDALACPRCGQPAGRRCDYGPRLYFGVYAGGRIFGPAHTGRYEAAAELGVVPRLPGTLRAVSR